MGRITEEMAAAVAYVKMTVVCLASVSGYRLVLLVATTESKGMHRAFWWHTINLHNHVISQSYSRASTPSLVTSKLFAGHSPHHPPIIQ